MWSAQSLRMSCHPEARLKLQQALRAGEYHSVLLWDSKSASLHASPPLECGALILGSVLLMCSSSSAWQPSEASLMLVMNTWM